jgi:hypothetical protein
MRNHVSGQPRAAPSSYKEHYTHEKAKMIIYWLNGPFGVGKTSAAQELAGMLPGSLLYDPEEVGTMMRKLLPHRPRGDFQHIPAWRPIVVATAHELLRSGEGDPLIVPMTLLHQPYTDEIITGLHERGVTVHHLLLHAAEDALRDRINGHDLFPDNPDRDAHIRQWRLNKISDYQHSRHWLTRQAQTIDTTELTPKQTAARILELTETPVPSTR